MIEMAIKSQAIDYFTTLDTARAKLVLSYMEALDASSERKHSLRDLKGKIQFADGYDYKAMRSAQ